MMNTNIEEKEKNVVMETVIKITMMIIKLAADILSKQSQIAD